MKLARSFKGKNKTFRKGTKIELLQKQGTQFIKIRLPDGQIVTTYSTFLAESE